MVNVDTSIVIRRPIEEVFGYLPDCTFEPVEGGTRVTLSVDGSTQGFFKLADSLLGPMFNRGMRADLANLKTLLEARAGRAA